MKAKYQVTVTRDYWNSFITTGYGIIGCEISVTRCLKNKKGEYKRLNGQLNKVTVPTQEEALSLKLLYGYTQYYSRNSMKFVMSRAARRRGYTTSDWRYNNVSEQHVLRTARK